MLSLKNSSLNPGIVEFYVRDCCNHAEETREIVVGVHREKDNVERQCRLLAALQLTRIDKNVVYDDREFAQQQADHCVGVRAKVGEQNATKGGSYASWISVMPAYYTTVLCRVHRCNPPPWSLVPQILLRILGDKLRFSLKQLWVPLYVL